MARRTSQTQEPELARILPLPEAVISHHGLTLFPAMKEWRSSAKIPPVLLITGASGVGKREMSTYLAQWILCDRNGIAGRETPFSADAESDGDLGGLFGESPASSPEPSTEASPDSVDPERPPVPCGQCLACHRALHGTWVDFTEILPEDGLESGGTLKIDQFRDLKSKMGFGAHQGAYRIILIPNADRMTPQAANSMLKLLEEPPRGWIFMLTASDPTLILPTVLSRCQTVRLRPFSTEELEELLRSTGSARDFTSAKIQVCAELAQGSWKKAVSFLNPETWEKRQLILDFIASPSQAYSQLVEWAAQDPRHFDSLLEQLEHLLFDLIRSTVGPHEWANSDAKEVLGKHAEALAKASGSTSGARDFWIARSARIAHARNAALAPLNRKLLVQDLLAPWLAPTRTPGFPLGRGK